MQVINKLDKLMKLMIKKVMRKKSITKKKISKSKTPKKKTTKPKKKKVDISKFPKEAIGSVSGATQTPTATHTPITIIKDTQKQETKTDNDKIEKDTIRIVRKKNSFNLQAKTITS